MATVSSVVPLHSFAFAYLSISSRLAFTRALTCLSKYGDDLSIYATPEFLAISATNSSMSAYCRFKYSKQFFARFHVGYHRRGGDDEVEEVASVTGQLLTKVSAYMRSRSRNSSFKRPSPCYPY